MLQKEAQNKKKVRKRTKTVACPSVLELYPPTPWSLEAKGKARGEAVHGRDTILRNEVSPEAQANRGSGFSAVRRSGEAHRGVSPFWTRCRGCGQSVCIGFERWIRHTSRGSGPGVFNGFEGRVRHTLASHSEPFWATSWA